MTGLVSLAEVQDAARRLTGVTVRTPLVPFPGTDVLVKPESLQPTGAFKLRGAYNAISLLPPEVRRRGVVTHSSGNHGYAVAYAAALLGVKAAVVVPENAPAVKTGAIERCGAELVRVRPTLAARLAAATEIEAARGYAMIPPFEDRRVIAGQGTIGLEIAADFAARPGTGRPGTGQAGAGRAGEGQAGEGRAGTGQAGAGQGTGQAGAGQGTGQAGAGQGTGQAGGGRAGAGQAGAGQGTGQAGGGRAGAGGAGAGPAAVVVPVSGGGLVSGIAVAIRALCPDTRVIGVEPELAADVRDSLRRGAPVAWPAADVARTVADALRVERVGDLTFAHIRELVSDIVTVTEDDMLTAVRRLALEARLVAEPGGAAAVAACLLRPAALGASASPERPVVAILSGGNISPALLARVLSYTE